MASASMAAPLAPLSPHSLLFMHRQDGMPHFQFFHLEISRVPKVTVPHLKPRRWHTGQTVQNDRRRVSARGKARASGRNGGRGGRR